MALSDNARAVLARRYLRRDGEQVVETPDEMFVRVARHVAAAERAYGLSPAEIDRLADRFAERMASLDFLPNSPTLMNAGRPLGQLAACFVVPVADTTAAIFEAVGWAAQIQKTGGGTGFAFSRLRPAGDVVESTGGVASGPTAFMQVFDVATEAIKQGGTRRGANMGILRVDHPDILDFIAAKLDPARMRNFNLSVAATDAFMAAAEAGGRYDLINPRTGAVVRQLEARAVLDLIANAAWAVGDPGLVFIDRINATQPTPAIGEIEATNPCVTGDTRVWVEDRGLVPIAELVGATPRVATFSDGAVVFRPTTRVVATGVRPVYRLWTLEGLSLRLTADHRMATERGDVRADALRPGQRVRMMTPRAVEVSRDSADARLGEVIGWSSGELRAGDGALSFHTPDEADARARLVDTVRALDPAVELVETPELSYVRGVDAATSRHRVPESVMRGNADLVAGYLRGLFSSASAPQLSLRSDDRDFLRAVQLLLLRLGIRAAFLRSEHGPVLAIERTSWPTFAALVGTLIPAKDARIAKKIAFWAKRPKPEPEWVTVTHVVLEGEEEVFDLTEPSTSHFFANGLLSHNCGEQPLLPFESCTLGSINLARFVDRGAVDWARLRACVHECVRFLDDVIDANRYPLPEIEAATLRTRKIGLGVMGLADLFAALGIPYDDDRALALGGELAKLVEDESIAASQELARTRGAFPAWSGSRWERDGAAPLRNATTTTVAPTGTISIIAGCSSGIEPLYAIAYERHVLDGAILREVHAGFRAEAEGRGFWSEELAAAIAARGGVRGQGGVPADVQARYPSAHELAYPVHVQMQAAFQRHVHAAVSKTINLPQGASPADVHGAYLLAYRLGCKGITVYRDGSRDQQVLVFGNTRTVDASAACPVCGQPLVISQRCRLCRHCGWSACG
ncbi:MAG TPA: ribonucleotide reductase N-terminal alpha domain-containing protein [Kofleriaceae bacterium]|nr:ribonucleotide reductase N-terminal alpha domain-containing protein [Kofleriaceae bacterium]